MENESQLASRLDDYMRESGQDQKQIAVKLGVTQQAVSLWLKGQTPRPNRVRQIEAMLRGDPIPFPQAERRAPAIGSTPEQRVNARLARERKEAEDLLANTEARAAELLVKERERDEARKVERERRRAEMQSRVREAEEEFIQALPPELAEHTHAVTHFDSMPWPCDYMSHNVCAQCVIVDDDKLFSFIEIDLLRLAALKAMHARRGAECDRYLLILINDAAADDLNKRTTAMCNALGIGVLHAEDPTAAAALVADAEYGPLSSAPDP